MRRRLQGTAGAGGSASVGRQCVVQQSPVLALVCAFTQPLAAPAPCPPEPGSELVKLAIQEMVAGGCEEAVLEAEVSNGGALKLYQGLGFIREKRLHRWAGGLRQWGRGVAKSCGLWVMCSML